MSSNIESMNIFIDPIIAQQNVIICKKDQVFNEALFSPAQTFSQSLAVTPPWCINKLNL